ncbi:MAG TPA: divalent-cation tolerance protein CutA [Methanosarcinales archaeon]|nr:divalent-cation tolerance protein CutA [Methanosarcinales archaeon]
MDEFVVILCTAVADQSEDIAGVLIEERLAACVNIIGVKSYFRWKGESCIEKEDLLVIKTRKGRIKEIISRITELHSYEVPEIIALPIIEGYDAYLGWVEEETR